MISNIQRFCIHDGSGIRTTVFFKGCPLRCAWCANPETQHTCAELMIYHARCGQCQTCISACPAHALSLNGGNIQVDTSQCTLCKLCVKACPNRAISIKGEVLCAQEILDIVRRDKPFYQTSGGGMTLSGGEPLYQPELALELLVLAKKYNIHTCIETSLACSFSVVEKVLPFLDEIYFDLKHTNNTKHKAGTGISNTQILDNIEHLLKQRPDARMRIPVIPGFNDTEKDILEICRALKEFPISSVELMWFHNLGNPKYSALAREYPYTHISPFSDIDKKKIKENYQANGIVVIHS